MWRKGETARIRETALDHELQPLVYERAGFEERATLP
jgi:hypothetical protein